MRTARNADSFENTTHTRISIVCYAKVGLGALIQIKAAGCAGGLESRDSQREDPRVIRKQAAGDDLGSAPVVHPGGLARLHAEAERVTLPGGDLLVREGALDDTIFIVVDGAVMLFKSLPGRRRQVVGFRFPDEPVMPCRPGLPWPVSVSALTRCELSRLSCGWVRGLAETDCEILPTLLDWAGDEIVARQQQLLTVGRMNTSERIATFILEIERRTESRPRQPEAVDLPMNRTAIADYLGLKTETVSRAFTRLIEQRCIALPRPNHVVLLDRPALRALAGGQQPTLAPAGHMPLHYESRY